MKRKIFALLTTCMLTLSLTACAGLPGSGSSEPETGSTTATELLNNLVGSLEDAAGNKTEDTSSETTGSESSESTSSDGKVEGVQSDPDVEVYDNEDGTYYIEGRIGDTLETAWFDFTVNDAYQVNELEGYTPSEGNVFVVVDMTLKNTFKKTVEIYHSDFQLQWGDDADDAFSYAISSGGDELLEGHFAETPELGIGETKQGLFIFEAPAGNQDFSVSFQEYYDNDEMGDLFFVFFTAKPAEGSVQTSDAEEDEIAQNGGSWLDKPALATDVVTTAEEWEGIYRGTVTVTGYGDAYDGIEETFEVYGWVRIPSGDDPYFELYSDDFDIWTDISFDLNDETPLVSMYVKLTDNAMIPFIKEAGDAYVVDMDLDTDGAQTFAMMSDGSTAASMSTVFTYVDPDKDGTTGMEMAFELSKVAYN